MSLAKRKSKIAFLFLLCTTIGFSNKKGDSIFVYKETINNDFSYYIVEKAHMEKNHNSYVKSYYCKNGKVFYKLSGKYRITEDTLFKCRSKEDSIGEAYMLKDVDNVLTTTTFPLGIPCETKYEGSFYEDGKTLFKFRLQEDVIDGSITYYYYDSSFVIVKIESKSWSRDLERIRIDTIPPSLKPIIDSLTHIEM
ncbi:MAG: hypothetical protein J5554_01175 [Paludibacteraceae bacterium]|nr:hypothetical protein [Paludibacteraceae bacterium]